MLKLKINISKTETIAFLKNKAEFKEINIFD